MKDFMLFIITIIASIILLFNFRTVTLKVVELTTPKCDPQITITRVIDGVEVERPF